MDQMKVVGKKNQRNPTRQWLSIELCAYVLLCLSLVTVAWANGHLSWAAVLVAWLLAAGVLTLALRGIYRGRGPR